MRTSDGPPVISAVNTKTGEMLVFCNGKWRGSEIAMQAVSVGEHLGRALPIGVIEVTPETSSYLYAAALMEDVLGDAMQWRRRLPPLLLSFTQPADDDTANFDVFEESEHIGCRSKKHGGRRCVEGIERGASDRSRREGTALKLEADKAEPDTLLKPKPEKVLKPLRQKLDELRLGQAVYEQIQSEPLPDHLAELDERLREAGTPDSDVRRKLAEAALEQRGVKGKTATRIAEQILSPTFAGNMTEIERHVTAVGEVIDGLILADIGEYPSSDTADETANAAFEALKAGSSETGELGEVALRAKKDLEAARAKYTADYSTAAVAMLSEMRDMGGQISTHKTTSKKAREHADDAAQRYPTAWLEASNSFNVPLLAAITKKRPTYVYQATIKAATTKTEVELPGPVEEQSFSGWELEEMTAALEHGTTRKVWCPKSVSDVRRRIKSIDRLGNGMTRVEYEGGTKMMSQYEIERAEAYGISERLKADGYSVATKGQTRDQLVNEMEKQTASRQGVVIDVTEPGEHGEFTVTYRKDEAGKEPVTKEKKVMPNLQSQVANRHNGGKVEVGKLATDGTPLSTVHEMAHRFEHVMPEIAAIEKVFWDRRCHDENGEPLERYDGGEKGKKEWFVKGAGFTTDYSTRRYGKNADRTDFFELLSTGVETVLAGEPRLHGPEGDSDHRAFTLGLLATI